DAKNFKLIWHYLASDKDITSTRTENDLTQLETTLVGLIHNIEAEIKSGKWETRITKLCDWCEYRVMCPAWKHPSAMEALPPNEYLQDTGVQLVAKYADLEARKADLQVEIKKIADEQIKIEQAAYAYGEKEDVLTIDGPGHRLIIKKEEEFRAPTKSEDPFSW